MLDRPRPGSARDSAASGYRGSVASSSCVNSTSRASMLSVSAKGPRPCSTWIHAELVARAPSDTDAPENVDTDEPDVFWGVCCERCARWPAAELAAATEPVHLYIHHLHRPIASSWWGIPLSSVRATKHQVALQLGHADRVPGSFEPPQDAVVLADAWQTIVHLHDFGDASARFPL